MSTLNKKYVNLKFDFEMQVEKNKKQKMQAIGKHNIACSHRYAI